MSCYSIQKLTLPFLQAQKEKGLSVPKIFSQLHPSSHMEIPLQSPCSERTNKSTQFKNYTFIQYPSHFSLFLTLFTFKHCCNYFPLCPNCCTTSSNMLCINAGILNTTIRQGYLRVFIIRAWLQSVLVYNQLLFGPIRVITLRMGEGSQQRVFA